MLNLKHRFTILILAIILAFTGLFAIQASLSSSSQSSWRTLQQEALARQSLLFQISHNAGYGALIHNFKNYVLRNSQKHYERTIKYYDETKSLITQYQALPNLTQAEQQALNNILSTLTLYRNAADQVKGLFDSGASIRDIDKAVKISDGPAIDGLRTLEKEYEALVAEMSKQFAINLEGSNLYMIAVIVIALIVILILVFWLNRFIVTRMNTLQSAVHGLANGDTDLTKQLDIKGTDEFAKLGDELSGFMSHLVELIRDIRKVSNNLESGLEHINSNAQGNADRTEQQKNETELLAAAVEELASTAHTVVNNTNDAVSAIEHAQNEFNHGVNALSSSSDSMQQLAHEVEQGSQVIARLKEQSDRIGEIVNVIGDIAEQTNLLALNAAIEAARAGEQGRGFAVVADEVRTLAGRTQQSTVEIRQMIEELQSGTENAVNVMSSSQERSHRSVSLVEEAESALRIISDEMTKISGLNLQIAEASSQQSAVTDETSANIQRIFSLSEETSFAVKENQNAIQSLDTKSGELNALVEKFKA